MGSSCANALKLLSVRLKVTHRGMQKEKRLKGQTPKGCVSLGDELGLMCNEKETGD